MESHDNVDLEEKPVHPVLTIEEAPDGRSMCMVSRKHIPKGELRVGMEVYRKMQDAEVMRWQVRDWELHSFLIKSFEAAFILRAR